ncbi:mRNA cap guanine-N7 methyltransferase 1 isoform X8 [Cryptomeria japonica]|uniref:mRNA cap guanine-N7 methyltransferase 1 isoform X8 n=1 Tax=Cryptomeria japonica TaxID=3369 RepID=UPI0025AC6D62|nr:mRNA cap guanine-N7 methyltransferase 1 isoform X8 [Cryptomeria japonica]
MKRGYEDTSSSSPPPGKQLKTSENDNTQKLAQKVAEHYSKRTNQTLEEREASPIIHLKKLNNWIEDCRTRYNCETDPLYRRKKFSFPARLICADAYEVRLDEELKHDAPFDICSCQFALHYSWSTKERARRALLNVSTLLRPGGTFVGVMPDANVIVRKLRKADGLKFGNSVYWISFDEKYAQKQKFKLSNPYGIQYTFHLEDAVDCPEWLVPFHKFKELAEEYELELVFKKNSHEFVHEYLKKPEFAELMQRLGALGDGSGDEKTLSEDEWDAAYLYLVFVLRKRGQGEATKKNTQRRQPGQIKEKDVTYLN